MGPVAPTSKSGCRYVFIVVDYFTRFVWARAVPTADGLTVLRVLQQEVFNIFGLPKSIYTDNATYFAQGPLFQFCKGVGITQFPAPKSHPSSPGLAERNVRSILAAVRAELVYGQPRVDPLDWDIVVPRAVRALNTRANSVHGFSPAVLMLGQNPTYGMSPSCPFRAVEPRLGNSTSFPSPFV